MIDFFAWLASNRIFNPILGGIVLVYLFTRKKGLRNFLLSEHGRISIIVLCVLLMVAGYLDQSSGDHTEYINARVDHYYIYMLSIVVWDFLVGVVLTFLPLLIVYKLLIVPYIKEEPPEVEEEKPSKDLSLDERIAELKRRNQ